MSDEEVTLREYLEGKIKELEARHELKFKAIDEKFATRDKALDLQAEANGVHFTALNNEAARILKAIEVTVSRDTWNAFKQSYDDWVRKVELAVGGLLPTKDFNSFKEEVNKSLQTKDGQRVGVTMTTSALTSIVIVVAAVAGIIFGIATWIAKAA